MWGGLNTSVNVRLLSDDEAYDTSNFSLDEIGSIKERDLFGQYNSASGIFGSNYFTGLFKHYTTDSKFFFACAGTKIGLGSGGTFTDITPTDSTVISGSYYSGISFNNRFYLFNPNDEPFVHIGSGSFHKVNNTTGSALVPGSNCAYSAVHKARAWAARSNSYPYRLYFSSLNNAENWTTTGGYVDLPDINQEIKGIISWGGYLYIFTETNIYILLGSTPNDFSLRKTNSMVGAIASRSIKITDIGICFLARSGVYTFDGNNSNKISIKIENTISNISKTLIQNACGLYDGRKYWLSYTPSGSNYNTKILIYDIYLKDWVFYQGDACNISYFERAYGGTDKGELYGGSSANNGIVYQLQSASGTESFAHSSESDFNSQITFNTVVTSAPDVEPYEGLDCYTLLLAHFNGVDGATAYTTEDFGKRTVTFGGTPAELDTAQKKFGLSSVLYAGAGWTSVPISTDWDFGTGNFTLEAWVKFNVLQNSWIFSTLNPNGWGLYYNNTSTNLALFSSYVASVNSGNGTFTPTTNRWYHIAVVRNGNDIKFYVDGSQIGTTQTAAATYNSNGDILFLGYMQFDITYINGWIDEPRISNIARYTSNFTPLAVEFNTYSSSGSLTSQNVQINAAGSTSLDKITWTESLPTNTKISFQTRTGTTNDTVYYNGWQAWTSTNTVTVNTVTDATVEWNTNDAANFKISKPTYPQNRNILYYEDERSASANLVSFSTAGAVSKGKFAWSSIALKDLSSYDWIGIWYKSPTTGNSVEFSLGEVLATENTVTFNTVQANGWEKAYWYIGGIASTARDGITKIGIQYRGDTKGSLMLGEVSAYNFYSSDDIISSTPNDWIQYRGIFGTNSLNSIPKLTSISLTYTPGLSVAEGSLSSYYYTKWFDFNTPQLNKQFDSIALECNSTTSNSVTIYCDYDIDAGIRTGTLSFPVTSTANTVRIFKNFPSNLSGKTMRLKLYNNDKDAQVTIKACEVRYRQEEATPN